MDEITKEVITSALRRIAKLEKEVSDIQKISTVQKVEPVIIGLPATEDQKKYIISLGGVTPKFLTKQKAGELIDSLLKDKKIKQISEAVVEPKEVDTDNAGLDSEGLL